MHLGRIGSLSTLSLKQPGWPFGSVMPYGLDGQGRPLFLISTMAMHTKNLLADARASLLVMQPDISGDPLGASRVTVMGTVGRVPKPDQEEVRGIYLAASTMPPIGRISATSASIAWRSWTSIMSAGSG